jgi:hypothetical protein
MQDAFFSDFQCLATPRILLNAIRENAAHGVIYLNNPKVGCSTVKATLWRALTGAVPTDKGGEHRVEGSPFSVDLADPDAVERAFIFTFVRNPYERIVSAYLNKVAAQKDKLWHSFAAKRGLNPEDEVSFDGFVKIIADTDLEDNDPHWRPQYLNTMYPFVRPNLIGDLNSLDDLLPQVLTRVFGQAAPDVASRQRHSTSAKTSWRSFFENPVTLKLVREVYGPDFALFGYSKDLAAPTGSTRMPLWSDAPHIGLARLARYLNAPVSEQFATLNALQAADRDGVLSDWILTQRMRRPRVHQTTVPRLVQENAAQIGGGTALLRKAVAAAQNPETHAEGGAGRPRAMD